MAEGGAEDILDVTKLNERDGIIGDDDDEYMPLDSTSKPPKQRILDGEKYESVPITSTSRPGSTEEQETSFGGVDARIKVSEDSMYEADTRLIEIFPTLTLPSIKLLLRLMNTVG